MNLPRQFGLCEAACVPHPRGGAGPRQTFPPGGNDRRSPSPFPLESDCWGGATGRDSRDGSIACGGDEPRRHFLASHNSYYTTSLAWCGLIIQKNNNSSEAGRSEINTSSGGEGFSPLLNLSHRCSHFRRPDSKSTDNRAGGDRTDTDTSTAGRRSLPSCSLLQGTPWALF